MGNCGSICTSNFSRLRGDIIMDKLIIDDDKSRTAATYNLYKVKYIQKVIKQFLKKKKNQKLNYYSHKSTKQSGSKRKNAQEKNIENNLTIHNRYNSHSKKSSSKSQNFKNSSIYKNSIPTKSFKNDSSPKNRTPKNRSPKNRSPKNKSSKNRSPKNRSPKNRGKNITFPKVIEVKRNNQTVNLISEIEICKNYNNDEPNNDNSIIIPTLKPELLENELFKKDPFRIGVRKSKYDNDPRDGPIDNIRRNYPAIIEDNSSYLGEWKNRKRDGLGLLCWEDGSKFFGYFSENIVAGYGRLWHQNGDSYKGQWNNYEADGWGIYYIKQGAFFRGMWSADKQNGFGIERWPRGSIFFGDYDKIIKWMVMAILFGLIIIFMKENLKQIKKKDLVSVFLERKHLWEYGIIIS